MGNAFKKYLDTLPKILDIENNPVLHALILALSNADDDVMAHIEAAKDQMFVKTASGVYLDILGDSNGVSRPFDLGLSDVKFRELIPNLSLKPKQIKKAFYETADIFWGPLFSRANLTSINTAPFNLIVGDILKVKVDNGLVQEIKVRTGDLALSGAATIEEVTAILSRGKGFTPSVVHDALLDLDSINLRTDTMGSQGSLEILSSVLAGSGKLNFKTGVYDILDLSQRVSIYNLNPNELIIELPATVPTLTRGLQGSHHFHADATLEVGNEWKGSFLYNPTSSQASYSITSQKAVLNQLIEKGNIYPSIQVTGASAFESQSGFLIFNFGKDEEYNVPYRAVPNTNTVLIDPTHVFQQTHTIGSVINVLSDTRGFVPNRDLTDLAVFMTSSAESLGVIQTILARLAAAGIILKFRVLAPKYKYLIDNPYLPDDDGTVC